MSNDEVSNLWLAITVLVCLVGMLWIVPVFGAGVGCAYIGAYIVVRVIGLVYQIRSWRN